jgi:hypothetical protein
VQMEKSDPEAQTKSSLSDCTWLERWVWSWSWILLKLLMHLESRGALFTFSFSLYIYTFFLSFLFHTFFLSSFLSFSYKLPLNSRLHCTYLLGRYAPCLDDCTSTGKEVEKHFVPG